MPSLKVKQLVLLLEIRSDINQVNITGSKGLYIRQLNTIVILNGKNIFGEIADGREMPTVK